MEEIIIRPATFRDIPVLLQFEQGVIAAEKPFDVTLKENPTYYDINEMIAAPHIEIVVAELNNELIASGYARIETSKIYLKHAQHAYFGFMYVLPNHRGMGINKRIIEHLKNWSSLKGIAELRLDVYFGNGPAIAAYEKIGFTKHMIDMRMGINQ